MEYDLYHQWEPYLELYKNSPNTEIEIRIGRKLGKKFDTNVGKDTFTKCLKALEMYKGWEQVTHSNMDVYYFDGGKRLTIREDSEDRESIVKERIIVNDFELKGKPFDVRLGISSETPFEYDGETATEQKNKERWSFVRKNLKIDASIVKGNPDDPDDDQDTNYQIELEIIQPSLMKTRDEQFNIVYKIFDILKCM